ncbi:endonuclease I family protein [Moritella viscosa]|uniref:endonuclease I family protein n=1 Tax=Moritella viscosa TaxID=80854 RepID=UPI0009224947|nr:endonuclease [Moritella viscosa]SHO12062.1 Cell surface protein [Moritella viscosa]
MKKTLIALAILATSSLNIAIAAKGDICTNCPDLSPIKDASKFVDGDYYTKSFNAINSNLATFRAALIDDISAGQKQLSYSEVWTALTHTDEDPTNSNDIILLYRGDSIPKNHNASTKPKDVSQSEFNDYWNREHVWAKSHGFPNSNQRGYTDIHHLRPSDQTVNSARSNKDFDAGGTPNAETNINLSTSTTWEPRDAVKGDVARMMLYMDVRYDVGTATGMPDLVLVNNTGTVASKLEAGPAKFGKLCTLIKWNYDDPVDSFERERNNTIYEYQGNRNPFIDHNEWVDIIYKDVCPGITVPFTITIDAIGEVTEKTKVTLKANANTPGTLTYSWTQKPGSPKVTLDTSVTGSASFTAPDIPDTESAEFEFEVTVTNADKDTARDTVKLIIKDINYTSTFDISVADAEDKIEGQLISLTVSSQEDNVRYYWKQLSGPEVSIINPYKSTVKFTTPSVDKVSKLTFQVEATNDSNGKTAIKTVNFDVDPTNSKSSNSSGGSFGIFGTLSLLGLGMLRRKAK